MKKSYLAFFVAATACLSHIPLSQAEQTAHNWNRIGYPKIPPLPNEIIPPVVYVQNDKEQGLRVQLDHFVGGRDDGFGMETWRDSDFTAVIHLIDGTVVKPKMSGGGGGFGDQRGSTWPHLFMFPWQRNLIEEAWIELHVPGQVYWLEMPYGFTRDPNASLTPLEPRRGPPAFALAMRERAGKDRLVHWLYAEYEIGEIQNHWQLTARISNPFDTKAELILYRNDGSIGRSGFLWDIHSPKTSITIRDQNGLRLVNSRVMNIRLHDDGLRRTDSFDFNHNGRVADRSWGTAAATVDEKAYEFTVPSSLFNYVEGVSDHNNQAKFDVVPAGQ